MITMGDDEFILYMRKNNFGHQSLNPELGRKICEWIKNNDTKAIIIERDKNCFWGDSGDFVNAAELPKTATQFRFDEALLPDLYRFLGTL